MDFLSEYGLFLAKLVTLLAGFVVVVITLASASQRMKRLEKQGHIEISFLNDKYRDMRHALCASILPDEEYKAFCKEEKKAEKARHKPRKKSAAAKSGGDEPNKSKLFVMDFDGDIRASACDALTEQVTAVLTQATECDEVVLRLESAGGMVHSYGLAAAQLKRIRDRNIPLTVCVDRVAASGGYMMACVAQRILAAPFAVLGSIGVVAQIPNLHRLLKKHDVDYEIHTAGEYKRTLTVFGENTQKARQKFQQELEETHDLFKLFVAGQRPHLQVDAVATGETWFGQRALDVGLVDVLQTSEDYLFQRHGNADIYLVKWVEKSSLTERLGLSASVLLERVLLRTWSHLERVHLFSR